MHTQRSTILQPWKKHWLFVMSLFVVGPGAGYWLAEDRGLLLGLAVSVFASVWLLWSRYERKASG